MLREHIFCYIEIKQTCEFCTRKLTFLLQVIPDWLPSSNDVQLYLVLRLEKVGRMLEQDS